MDFGKALEALKQGKKVKRSHWGGFWYMEGVDFNGGEEQEDYYERNYSTEIIMAKLKDGGFAPAQAYQVDLLAEDWQLVE